MLSLVAETVKSDVPSGSSANTTILALLGVELAVNVSDIKVNELLRTLDIDSINTTVSMPKAVSWGLLSFTLQKNKRLMPYDHHQLKAYYLQ